MNAHPSSILDQLTERGALVRAAHEDRLCHTPPAIGALSDEDAATLLDILLRATS